MGLQEQLATALQNAHAAGDVDAARQLAQALKEQMSRQQQPQQSLTTPPPPVYEKAPKKADGALSYSVDQAQRLAGKGAEAFGDLIGSDTVKQFGTDVVAQQDKDIEEGGYKPTYTGSLRDTYDKGGFSEAVGWIAEKSAENAASGGAAIAGTGLAAITAPFSLTASALIGGSTLVGSAAMGAGESAFEQEEKTGEYDSAVASGTGVIVGILDKFGAGKVIPKPDLAKLSGQELVEKLIKAGKPNAAQAIGKRIIKSTVSEGATETAQEAVIAGSAATQGGKYTKDELIDRGLEAFVLGGTMGGSVTTTVETAKATGRGIQNVTGTAPEVLTPEEQAARTDVANRVGRIADENNMNVKNVGKMGSKGAVDAVDNAHTEIVSDINLAVDGLNQTQGTSLGRRKTDTAEQAAKKETARLGIKNAKNKVKGIVTIDQIKAVEELVGGTTEGQQLINLMRESNELTALHKSGYVGGVSQFTDLLSPLGANTGYDRGAVATERLLRPLLTGGAAFQTGGASLALQTGAAVAGRAIDAVTGRRSRVAKFIKDNRGQGSAVNSIDSARARGLAAYRRKEEERRQARLKRLQAQRDRQREDARRAAEKQAEELRKEAINQQLWESGARERQGYTGGSPQDVLLRATGMDIPNLVKTLAYIIRNNANGTSAFIAAKSAMRSLKKGGEITYLNELITLVKDSYEAAGAIQPNPPEPRAFGEYQEGQRRSRAYEEGKRQNIAAANALIDAVQQDGSLDAVTKGLILERLQEYANGTIGSDPVRAIQTDMESAVQKGADIQAVQKYMGPYLDRIMKQQPQQGTEQPQPPQPEQPQPPQPEQPQPPQPEQPAQEQSNSNAITPSVTPETLNTMTPTEAAKELRRQLKEAAQDPRYYNKDSSQYKGRTAADFGAVSFPKAHWTNESASIVLALKNEIDQIADKFNVPRVRGIKHGIGAYGANMGDGVMQLNSDSFYRYSIGINQFTSDISAEERRAKVDALKSQISEIKEQNKELRRQRESLPQGSYERADLTDKINENNNKGKSLLLEAHGLTNDNLNKSNWKLGDPLRDRPVVGDAYADTGLEQARHTLFHEMGHHIHAYFGNVYVENHLGGKVNRRNYTRPIEDWLRNHKSEVVSTKAGNNKTFQQAIADIEADTSENNLRQFQHYAQWNSHEWFCENFATYFMGNTERVDPVFVKLIESILKDGKVPK